MQKDGHNPISEGETSELMAEVYDQLHQAAGYWFNRQPSDHTLQPTALVHEAFLKIASQKDASWEDRVHFMALASKAMRQILIDYSRRRKARKRGGDWARVTLTGISQNSEVESIDVLSLNEALEELEQLNETQARIIEMRFLGGMTTEEIAKALSISNNEIQLEWRMARAWLQHRIQHGDKA